MSVVRFIRMIIIFFIISSFILDQSILPDYDAYERIYIINDFSGDWEILFTLIMYTSKLLNLTYDSFRTIHLFFCLFTLYKLSQNGNIVKNKLSHTESIILFFLVNLFLIEFFLIRIRAGLCISFIFLATSYFENKKYHFSFLLFLCSFFIHKSTFVVLSLIYVPFIILQSKSKINGIISIIYNLFATCLILFYINNNFEERGSGLNSPLNVFRFYALTIPPILLYILYNKENRNNFNFYFNKFYIFFLTGLILMYYLGYTEYSGEAIVRVYTLATVPALYSIFRKNGLLQNKLNMYILVSNSLFFLYTIGFLILFKINK